jgi:hypothetical protein
MRALLLVLVLAGCGADDTEPTPIDAHALGACDQDWQKNGYTECEAACFDAVTALNAQGEACHAMTANGEVNCSKTFEFAGLVGCCAGTVPQMLFGECD